MAAWTVDEALGALPRPACPPNVLRESSTLAGRIDHTLLKADATRAAIDRLCAEARENGFASVCVNGRWVPRAVENLAGSRVMVCTVAGFPLGAASPGAKALEAALAVEQGAGEVDMVMDLGGLLSGDLSAVFEDLRGVVRAARGRPVKVILETCLLSDEQKAVACLLAVRAGCAYVKTSTGLSRGGATRDDVRLMRAMVGELLGVKASGGIRDRRTAEAMLAAGADRLGTSASVAIVRDAGTEAGPA